MKKTLLITLLIFSLLFTACATNSISEITPTPSILPIEQTPLPSTSPTISPIPVVSEPAIEEVYIIDELLYGKWILSDGLTKMELTNDGKIIDNGVYSANYKVLENNKVKILSNSSNQTEAVIITYALEDNLLKWGESEDSYLQYEKEIEKAIKKEINFADYANLSSEKQGFWFNRQKNHIPSGFNKKLATLLDQYNCAYIGDTDNNKVYITTDMGYENGNTEFLLDYYKENNIKIMFFLTGDYIDYHPDLVQRMIDEGHLIGNHTFHHYNLGDVSIEDAYYEIKSVEDKLYDGFGITCKYLRYPEGGFTEQVLALSKDMGYIPVFWSSAFADWSREDTHDEAYFYNMITDNMHNGALMLIHNVIKNEAHCMPDVIKYIEDNNYELGDIREFLNTY